MKKLVIDGQILAREERVGVPRYARELVHGLDKLENLPFEVIVAIPCEIEDEFKNLKKVIVNPSRYEEKKAYYNLLWQIVDLPKYLKKNDCIFLELSFEYQAKHNDVTVIYDLQPEHFPGNYVRAKSAQDFMRNMLAKRTAKLRKKAITKGKKVIAISNWVKQDIVDFYHVDPDRIGVVYCAWQHFENVGMDEEVFDKFHIERGNYFFCLGSRYKHKNLEWVYRAAQQNPNENFVVTGYNNLAAYSEDLVKEAPANVQFTGFLSDEMVKALMHFCKGFIHPSMSEGFGMTPLEAMSAGATNIIVSNATALPEVYEDCVHYIEPTDYENINLEKILAGPVAPAGKLLEKYSWVKSAQALVEYLKPLLEA